MLWNDASGYKPDKNHIILALLHQVGQVILTTDKKGYVLLLRAVFILVFK